MRNKTITILLALGISILIGSIGFIIYNNIISKESTEIGNEVEEPISTAELSKQILNETQNSENKSINDTQNRGLPNYDIREKAIELGYEVLGEEGSKIILRKNNDKYYIDEDSPYSIIPYDMNDVLEMDNPYDQNEETGEEYDAAGDLDILSQDSPCFSYFTNVEELIDAGVSYSEALDINYALSIFNQAELGLREKYPVTYISGSYKLKSDTTASFKIKVNNETMIMCLHSHESGKTAFKILD